MKTKSLFLIAFVAIITLSFSFASTSRPSKANVNVTAANQQIEEPIRGFISEDKF